MKKKSPSTLGSRITECREGRGWTQKRLSEEAGISITFLSEIENDKRSIGSDALLRLADALGASLDYLLKGEVQEVRATEPLVIPPELEEAAMEKGWSLQDASDLVKARQLIFARRSQSGRLANPAGRLTKQEWIDLYSRLFENGNT